jgi:hypothetical protein
MPVPKSFPDTIRDWEKLIAAYLANSQILGAMDHLRLALQAFVDQARELKNEQDVQRGINQRLTQTIQEVIRGGAETARRMRAHVKAVLGTRNELLESFQVSPIRDRRSRRGDQEQPAPTEPPGEIPPEDPPPDPVE